MNLNNLKEGFWVEKRMVFLFSTYLTLISFLLITPYFTTELFLEENFMIGEATAKGVNVSARISNFYTLFFLGITIFTILLFILNKLNASFFKKLYYKSEFSVLITLQILLSIFYIFNGEKSESDAVLHLSILYLFGLELFQFISKKEFKFLKEDVLKSLFLSIIAIYLITENIFITATIILVLLFLMKLEFIQKKFQGISIVLTALPFLLFLTVELTLILNQNGFYNWQYGFSGVIVLLILFSISFLKKVNKKSLNDIIFKWQAPMLILGASIYLHYSPVISFSADLFEAANNLNPLMMSEVYKTTYFMDYISSHLLSDYVWMKLYALLNGYENDTSALIYYSFSFFVYTLTIYYFLKEFFNSHFGVILFMLFMPYVFFYFPYSYAFTLIPLIFLNRYFTTKKIAFLWWFGITSTLTLFWRLDLGIATIGASIIAFIFLFLFEKNIRVQLIKIVSTLTIFYGLILAFYHSYKSDFISEAIHYFGGSQAHGNSLLTKDYSNLFYLDYFILPGIIGLIILYLLFNFKLYAKEKFFWIVIFFAGFYFFNFQRGLVRHSFYEMNESYISSFSWLILIILYVRFYHNKISLGLFPILLVGGFLLSIHTIENTNSLLNSRKSFSVNELPKIKGDKVNRVTENYDFNKYTLPAIDFIKDNLKNDETFFDFSNSPILYYHSEKRIPTNFSQSLQYIVDLYLQKECVNKLKKQKIPWIVHNQVFDAFGDNIDNVPNNIRYYYIASYLIDEYTPDNNYGLFHFWRKKDVKSNDSIVHEVKKEYWNLGLMPYFWKANPKEPEIKFKRKLKNFKSVNIGKIEGGDFIQFTIKAEKKTEFKMFMKGEVYNDFEVKFDLLEGTNKYKFPICGSYYLRVNDNPNLVLETAKENQILKIEILNQKIEY